MSLLPPLFNQPPHMTVQPSASPFATQLAQAEVKKFPPVLAEFMGLQEGDFLARVCGHCMEGVGIPNGSFLVLRPLNQQAPEVGSVVLVEIELASGQWHNTIKTWDLTPQGFPLLRDGTGAAYLVPEDARSIEALAFKVGILTGSSQ